MRYLILLALICMSYALFGQDSKKLGKAFIMTQNYNAKTCDAVGGNQTASPNALERKFIIIVEAMTSTGYVVSVPSFKKDDLNDKFLRTKAVAAFKSAAGIVITPAQPSIKLYFLIPYADFDNVTERSVSKHSFAVGIPTIPAKIRFGNSGKGENAKYFRFEGNVSLGLSGGYKYSFGDDRKNAVDFLFGFTVASVQVDSLTTKGKVNSNTSLETLASLSPHLGIVFEVEKIQFGIYSGVDFLNGAANTYWVYRNKPWLGIGIGYSIFSIGGNNSNK